LLPGSAGIQRYFFSFQNIAPGSMTRDGAHAPHPRPTCQNRTWRWNVSSMILGVALLSPLLFPDSILGLLGGFVFGLGAGTVYYFAAAYAGNLAIFTIAGT
jgi:uncharacterized membrane protein YdjX (TVP38/TMEM64 family)